MASSGVAPRVEPVMRLDVSAADLTYGLQSCVLTREAERATVEQALEDEWAPDALVALSVRTGFDALLTALQLPRGAEVLVSAITIPDMIKIIEAHGLRPIAVDIDFDTLAPCQDLLEKACTPHSRMLLVSHIFGAICNLDAAAEWAARHRLFFVDDCAEVYCGPDFRGHPRADASFFSFGSIKTETALGGALLRVADAKVRTKVRDLLTHYAVQPLSVFRKRILKYLAYQALCTSPAAYAKFVRAVRATHRDHLDVMLANSRGFAGMDLFRGIRLRPPVALLKLLLRRLQTFDPVRLERRRKRCGDLARLLASVPGIRVPGLRAEKHLYWLFPVCIDYADPVQVARFMLAHGFDATTATTSLMCVDDVVTERPLAYEAVFEASRSTAAPLMRKILYLPISADTSKAKVSELATVLQQALAPPASPLQSNL
ncbi:UDP-4-amino-4-deoxy-L-arabinose--oxoglutarate aminotransferase [Hondaea fermentalgiana]|uniref:UDP-4-amino-4-deoxy-L-arabinose--oxoglutarate aminotransferase n=1 Tax=Hondaea fermentalgiana TaxID=2315210 RepID=A0A2R5GYF9_9STRA|nr:UDP-4-amino-4-deoxy-L-arabinose--oxoglutarate aminotransferase [Hondaea fermentalgiana]|eukprot:GBG34848.1 UDP-4-amino-4-deoxy-L-arabinose--oxoglutarate aminotransferase [Hondaea fermentalgiana]